MNCLKIIFGDKSLTYNEFELLLKNNKQIKVANLAEGKYVDINKYKRKVKELNLANKRLEILLMSMHSFISDSVKENNMLKSKLRGLEEKYEKELRKVMISNTLDLAILKANINNTNPNRVRVAKEKLLKEKEKFLTEFSI